MLLRALPGSREWDNALMSLFLTAPSGMRIVLGVLLFARQVVRADAFHCPHCGIERCDD
jgi:hypothetical protein